MKKLLIGCLLLLPLLATAGSIDRKSVISRNNPHISGIDTLSSLSVGNGTFAATVDFTGLQTFPDVYRNGVPLCTMSQWGWHAFANPEGLVHSETERVMDLHGRRSVYAVEYKDGSRQQRATQYFRVNPHRLNLATIGWQFLSADRQTPLGIDDFTDIDQTLDLWSGTITSRYKADGVPVDVVTTVLQDCDCLDAKIQSDLWAKGRMALTVDFPYPTGAHSDDARAREHTDSASVVIIAQSPDWAVVKRTMGVATYYILIMWEGKCTLVPGDDGIALMPAGGDRFGVAIEFLTEDPGRPNIPFKTDTDLAEVAQWWQKYWSDGAIVDFSDCTDPRAPELERRVVLSQYLTQINCAGILPPQETGLTYNSWFGRPHLEMIWWHALHFALWNRPDAVAKMLDWYNYVAAPDAWKIAQRQGFDGLRWMKMTDPWAGEAPSNTGSFLIWQQPHYIYLAEEMYRANPGQESLDRYGDNVEATAEFMASYARACAPAEGPIVLYGHTAMQESMSKDFSCHHPFEQAYWRYGLLKANEWRERQGLERHAEWDSLATRLAPLAIIDGIYASGIPTGPFVGSDNSGAFDPYVTPAIQGSTSISEEAFRLKSRSDHPAVLGACGMLPPSQLYEADTMDATLQWILANWNWPTTWGWDYGMTAMAAARLGHPDQAIDMLLCDKGKNTYLPNGHNFQEPKRLRIYLPGNGALLAAVAMMCAGWDNSPEGAVNPGFPADGTWNVKWEGLHRMQ